jgi:hypothetical protein
MPSLVLTKRNRLRATAPALPQLGRPCPRHGPHSVRPLRGRGQLNYLRPRFLHPLLKRVEAETDEAKAKDLATLLLEQAEIAAGAQLPDPSAFVQRMNRALLGI